MSRRLSVAYRPGAVGGGRGGLPPAGLAAPHRAERGALIQYRVIQQPGDRRAIQSRQVVSGPDRRLRSSQRACRPA